MPNKTLFTFSSFDYPDCRIYTNRVIVAKYIAVQVVQPSTLVTSLVTEPFGRENIVDEVKGRAEVSGTLFDVTGDVDFNDAHPFTIWIWREDVGVELIVMDCWLINNSERETNFTARAIVDWHPIGQRAGAKTIPPNQPVTISGLQVTLPCRNEDVNQNKDRFVGILESWEPQAKQYQHVDKTVPRRTYHFDRELDPLAKNKACPACGAEGLGDRDGKLHCADSVCELHNVRLSSGLWHRLIPNNLAHEDDAATKGSLDKTTGITPVNRYLHQTKTNDNCVWQESGETFKPLATFRNPKTETTIQVTLCDNQFVVAKRNQDNKYEPISWIPREIIEYLPTLKKHEGQAQKIEQHENEEKSNPLDLREEFNLYRQRCEATLCPEHDWQWIEDTENNTVDPQDGEKPFCYWWEDMRHHEVKVVIQEAYERGCTRGAKATKTAAPADTFIVDHRYAQDQIRYRLLLHLLHVDQDVEALANKSGLATQHIHSVCLGKGGLSYFDMAKLVKAIAGDHVALLVTMPWQECGQAFSDDNATEDDIFRKIQENECRKLCQQARSRDIVPNYTTKTKESGNGH